MIITKLYPQIAMETFTGMLKYLELYCMEISSSIATRPVYNSAKQLEAWMSPYFLLDQMIGVYPTK